MNQTTLQELADYVRTIPQDDFNMRYRSWCVYGHLCNLLGADPLTRAAEDPKPHFASMIAEPLTDTEILYMYHGDWADHQPSPTEAADRILTVLNHGELVFPFTPTDYPE